MATVEAFSGNLSIAAFLRGAFSGDLTAGEQTQAFSYSVAFTDSGGVEPDCSAFLSGTITATTTPTDYLLIAASAPFGTYSRTAPVSATDRIKLAAFYNSDATNTITVKRGAANGCPIFNAASAGIDIPPGGIVTLYYGTGTAVLTTTSNDKVTVVSSVGNCSLVCVIGYGH